MVKEDSENDNEDKKLDPSGCMIDIFKGHHKDQPRNKLDQRSVEHAIFCNADWLTYLHRAYTKERSEADNMKEECNVCDDSHSLTIIHECAVNTPSITMRRMLYFIYELPPTTKRIIDRPHKFFQ